MSVIILSIPNKNNEDQSSKIKQLNGSINVSMNELMHIFALFYMNGCGHCEVMHPEWKKLASLKNINNKCIILDVESEHIPELDILSDKDKSSINSFPTIKHITIGPNGKQLSSEDYNGDRKEAEFKKWIQQKTNTNTSQTGGNTNNKKYTKNTKNTKNTKYKSKRRRKKSKKNISRRRYY